MIHHDPHTNSSIDTQQSNNKTLLGSSWVSPKTHTMTCPLSNGGHQDCGWTRSWFRSLDSFWCNEIRQWQVPWPVAGVVLCLDRFFFRVLYKTCKGRQYQNRDLQGWESRKKRIIPKLLLHVGAMVFVVSMRDCTAFLLQLSHTVTIFWYTISISITSISPSSMKFGYEWSWTLIHSRN